jgi:hypothetical protein
MIAAGVSAIVYSIYGFSGVSFFHGLARIGRTDGKQAVALQILSGIEGTVWLAAAILSGLAAYTYHGFRASCVKGLSVASRNSILAANTMGAISTAAKISDMASRGAGSDVCPGNADAAIKRARINALRDKYKNSGCNIDEQV